MKKIKILVLSLLAVLTLSASTTAFAATLDNLMSIIIEENVQAAYDINLNAPFSKEMGGFAENINTETGEIEIRQTLMSIPGKNGMDLSLAIKYESSNAYLYNESTSAGNSTGTKGMTAYYNVFAASNNFLRVDQQNIPSVTTITGTLTIGSEKWIFNGRYSYSNRMYTVTGMQNAAIGRPAGQPSLYVLGEGWRFDIPYMTNEKGVPVIVMPSGQACIIDLNLPNGLSGYKLADYTFASYTGVTVSGVQSAYLLKHMSGMCYYLSANGGLIRAEDKFGNKLDYTWDASNLTKITDNASRSIEIAYASDTVKVSGGSGAIILHKTAASGHTGKYLLTKITNQLSEQTVFTYSLGTAQFNAFSATAGASNTYANLSSVTFPNGLKSEFAQKIGTKSFGTGGYMQYFRITSRSDSFDGGDYNALDYTYTGEPDGYGLTSKNIYTYETKMVDQRNQETLIRFNEKHQPFMQSVMQDKTEISRITREFDELDFPTKITTRLYGENTSLFWKVDHFKYDNRGNLTFESHPIEPEGDKTHATTYTYDSRFNLLTKAVAEQDSTADIIKKYTLTDDGKSIATEETISNSTVFSYKEYAYDSYGDLIWISAKQDESASSVTNIIYGAEGKGIYPTKIVNAEVRDANGNANDFANEYTYDVKTGNLLSVADPAGNTVIYAYDAIGRIVKETLPDGSFRTKTYDDIGNTLVVTDATAAQITYDFDPLSRLIAVESPFGRLLTRAYDPYGQLLSEADGEGNMRHFEYDSLSRLTSAKTFAPDTKLAQHTTIDYHYVMDGRLPLQKLTVTNVGDVQNLTSVYYYDRFDFLRIEEKQAGELFIQTRYNYDARGNPEEVILPNGQSIYAEYDPFGKVLKEEKPGGAVRSYQYDLLGNLIAETNEVGVTSYYTYDALSRQISAKLPFDSTGTFSTTKYFYDAAGNLERTVDPLGYATENVYNERGFLVSVKAPTRSGAGETLVKYTYDAEGRPLTMDQSGAVTSYTYDMLGRVVSIVDPMGQRETYSYDLTGKITGYTDRNGVIHTSDYDAVGRKLGEYNSKEGEKTAVSYTYDLNGLLRSIGSAGESESMSYDEMGRVSSVRYDSGTLKEYTYDVLSRVTNMTAKQGGLVLTAIAYTYDEAGSVTQIRDGAKFVKNEYDKAGRIIKEQNGLTGMLAEFAYYPSGALKSKEYTLGGGLVSRYDYTYDLRGNITQKLEGEQQTSYTYDPMSRLSGAVLPDGTGMYYRYDTRSNIETLTRIKDNTITETGYTYDLNNRLLTEVETWRENETTRAYEYDRNGSLTGKSEFARQGESQLWSTSSTYEYNGSNQLVRVFGDNGLSEYSYYPGGLRSSKRVNGETTRFVYHESRIIAELGEDYGLKASNLFGSGILFREAGDKTISYLTDGHGDVVGLSDAFGKVTSRKEYEPFGKERQPEATGFGKGILRELQREEADGIDNPFGYCGEYLDEETGFIYLRARYYSPDTGRFISEDPIRDGLNWYTYCVNNPLRYIDPTGMIVTKWDENHCSDDELKLLQDYTKAYEDGNKEAHKWAESIRDRHRGENEVGTDWGYTVMSKDVGAAAGMFAKTETWQDPNLNIQVTTSILYERIFDSNSNSFIKLVAFYVKILHDFDSVTSTVTFGQSNLPKEGSIDAMSFSGSSELYITDYDSSVVDSAGFTVIGIKVNMKFRNRGSDGRDGGIATTVSNNVYFDGMYIDPNGTVYTEPVKWDAVSYSDVFEEIMTDWASSGR